MTVILHRMRHVVALMARHKFLVEVSQHTNTLSARTRT